MINSLNEIYFLFQRSIEDETELSSIIEDAIAQYSLNVPTGNSCKEKLICEAIKLSKRSTFPFFSIRDALNKELR